MILPRSHGKEVKPWRKTSFPDSWSNALLFEGNSVCFIQAAFERDPSLN